MAAAERRAEAEGIKRALGFLTVGVLSASSIAGCASLVRLI